jgi:DNA repair protein RadC
MTSGAPRDAYDHRLTRRVNEAANILQIQFLDHIIIGIKPPWFSFKEAGVL